jgi:hypothetical protein
MAKSEKLTKSGEGPIVLRPSGSAYWSRVRRRLAASAIFILLFLGANSVRVASHGGSILASWVYIAGLGAATAAVAWLYFRNTKVELTHRTITHVNLIGHPRRWQLDDIAAIALRMTGNAHRRSAGRALFLDGQKHVLFTIGFPTWGRDEVGAIAAATGIEPEGGWEERSTLAEVLLEFPDLYPRWLRAWAFHQRSVSWTIAILLVAVVVAFAIATSPRG